MDYSTSRRRFLAQASAGLAGGLAAVRRGAVGGANDRIVVGLIGCGGRGKHDAELFRDTPNVEVAYVCDVDESRRGEAAQMFNLPSDRALGDMRRILDQKSVDAVLVTTPDHWHSLAAILACDAGKHVYVEKPISHNIREGRLLVEAAAQNKVLVQHGTQNRSTGMMTSAIAKAAKGCWGT